MNSHWKKSQILNMRLAVLQRPHHNNDTVHNAAFSLGSLEEKAEVLKIDIAV